MTSLGIAGTHYWLTRCASSQACPHDSPGDFQGTPRACRRESWPLCSQRTVVLSTLRHNKTHSANYQHPALSYKPAKH